ncbi:MULTISPECIES: NADH-dependent flavin oxidoreductase [unclassified Pseudomonas]|uniref:NADH-dependent flavin oxidoreductase n=1 Tax=unclassified Pseudomonas TaxID=196821 RepID=UPI000CD1EE23|nr:MULTISPECIES: NADH-dependent flavin oxidoreductase [unclassified Pseudomonas]POA53998.1 NADH:flavin oxidoreductase [Pseudomonas sp. FW507-12TSA]
MSRLHSKLFEPLALADGITLRNRVVMSPMTTWSATEDLHVSTAEEAYYRRRAKDIGLVITGCAQVTASGIGFPNGFSATDDCFIPGLRRLAMAAKSGGAPAILQLYHAGNKARPELVPNGDVVSASAVPTIASSFSLALTPRALQADEIEQIVEAFGDATRRAIEAGFDGIELHAAHGLLMQNFLSPTANIRQDKWGGSLENRMRFPLAIVTQVSHVIALHADRPFVLGVRLSPEESDGYRIDQTFAFVDRLLEQGVDYIHVSLASLLDDRPYDDPDGALTITRVVERVAGRVPVLAAGAIQTPEQAEQALETGISGVAIGRGIIIDPDWVDLAHSAREVETELDPAKISALEIPQNLWEKIQDAPGWVPLKDVQVASS